MGASSSIDGAVPVRGIEERLAKIFDAAGVDGFLHVRDVDGPAVIGFREHDPVLLASSRKVALLLELARGMTAGEWNPSERLRVRAPSPPAGYGIAQLRDEVELSLRDLATLMVSVSDNVATALIAERVGASRVNRMLAEIGVPEFVFRHPTYDSAAHDPAQPFGIPSLGARATAEAASRLLTKVWRDEAGPPEACAEVRRVLATQVWTHRLRSGFPDEVRMAGKTGSWMGWKNEIGVAEFPEGGRYAIAVFTRLRRPPEEARLTAQDIAIGTAAAAAVEALRTGRSTPETRDS